MIEKGQTASALPAVTATDELIDWGNDMDVHKFQNSDGSLLVTLSRELKAGTRRVMAKFEKSYTDLVEGVNIPRLATAHIVFATPAASRTAGILVAARSLLTFLGIRAVEGAEVNYARLAAGEI